MADGTRTLLLSARTRELIGPRIRAIAGPGLLHWVTPDEAVRDPELHVDACFISRDITGLSTKTVIGDALRDCYAVLRRSQTLSWVQMHSAGSDRPIYAELAARGVCITSGAGVNAQVVAHTALMGVLALARRLPELLAAQARREWAPLVRGELPRDLAGQTAVLVGWGAIGQALLPMLAAAGLHTVVVRRQAEPAGPGIETVAVDQLHAVLPRADWLLLACPLTAATRGLIDAAALRLLPPQARLVNVSRGEVVVEDDLVAALQEGHLAGAFLDVFEIEPLPTASPLWILPNVLITPHSAGQSDGNEARVADIFLRNLQAWLEGRPMINEVARSA